VFAAQDDRILAVCTSLLKYFATYRYIGRDPGARARWLRRRTQFLPRNASSACNSESFFFSLTHHSLQDSQNSRPRPQQRHMRLKRLRIALTRSPRSDPPPAPPTTPPPITTSNTLKSQLRHIFTRPPQHTTPPVVDVPFAKGKEVRPVNLSIHLSWISDGDMQRNAAAGAPGKDPNIISDEEYENLNVDPGEHEVTQPQQQTVAVHIDPGEHGGGKSCICC
jgi:hypothetical protein